MYHAGHAAFVLFMRTVTVEVTEADNCALEMRHQVANIVVEHQLGIAIDVKRTLIGRNLGESGTGTVYRCGGCIDKGDLTVGCKMKQLL